MVKKKLNTFKKKLQSLHGNAFVTAPGADWTCRPTAPLGGGPLAQSDIFL